VPTLTRRERLRADTITEIKQAALDQIATHGAPSLSIRGIARDIGMSPAGLYRYYESLDTLITELVTDTYTDLATTVEAATDAPATPRDRLRAGMHAYRDWATSDPQRFLLIFGTPIPGYAAPEDGPTEQANRRIGAAFFRVAADAMARGELTVPDPGRPLSPTEEAAATRFGTDLPPAAVPALVSAYAHFHGLVTLEVLGQLSWLYPHPEAFYAAEVDRMLDLLLS
jgi:AcrR family transcriptional regulator